jgi:hypothetical protein
VAKDRVDWADWADWAGVVVMPRMLPRTRRQ